MSFATLKAFIRLTRPFFLLGGVLLYLLGVVISLVAGAPFNLAHYLTGQLLVTSSQLMVHYANEYYDREVDAATGKMRTWFSGGSGVMASGALTPGVARRASRVCLAASLVMLLVVAFQAPLAGAVGAVSLLGAWSYSAPPIKLMGSGWGEVSASLIVAFLTPLMGLLLQAGGKPLPAVLFLVCLPLLLIHIAMLLAFEFPDRAADATFGKRTLAVRLGLPRAVWLHNGLLSAAFALYSVFALLSLTGPAGRYVLFALPLAVWQAVWIGQQTRRMDPGRLSVLVIGAVGLFGLSAALTLLGLVVKD